MIYCNLANHTVKMEDKMDNKNLANNIANDIVTRVDKI